ncbi:hypothetical protein ACKQTC_00305 [Peptococcus simiae]|uniref:CvpA family protein n=1 Tax=Peptococcus simiae TaxID=1643805 RepID=A0ABW9GVP6_9FIRM
MKNFSLPIKILLFIALIGVSWYVWLPPLHLQSTQFWIYVFALAAIGALFFVGGTRVVEKTVHYMGFERTIKSRVPSKRLFQVLLVIGMGVALVVVVGFVSSTQVFHAGKYAHILDKENEEFTEKVQQLPPDRLPTVDRDTAIRLGNRKMGEVVDLVSQFTVSDQYTQINYQDDPVRVSPLRYASLVKWLMNTGEGIPYYMRVNMIDGKTDLVKSEKPLRYSKSEHFNRHITRHLRLQYPLKLFYNSNFEVDEKGVPYWITPVYRMSVGLFGGPDVKEVIVTNAQDGASKLYKVEDAPTWIDCVYEAPLILNQINWNGKYQRGFINSIIGQKGVLRATDGYNYLALKDDVFLYTGITSVSADDSNIGFVLVNMRTKECVFYSVASAEEFSAMGSAEGAVQEKQYKATFPLLINMGDRPTYFLSLKDEAGLIKMYAFIDAENYQHVVTSSNVAEAYKTYASQQNVQVDPGSAGKSKPVAGKLVDIQSVVIEGNSVFYMLLEGDSTVYMAQATISEQLPFIHPGDEVTLKVAGDGQALRVTSLERGLIPEDETLEKTDKKVDKKTEAAEQKAVKAA